MILDDIQAKLFEISYLKTKLERDLQQKKDELLHLAIQFESYAELYSYTKKMSHSLEEFNVMMAKARDIFLDKY